MSPPTCDDGHLVAAKEGARQAIGLGGRALVARRRTAELPIVLAPPCEHLAVACQRCGKVLARGHADKLCALREGVGDDLLGLGQVVVGDASRRAGAGAQAVAQLPVGRAPPAVQLTVVRACQRHVAPTRRTDDRRPAAGDALWEADDIIRRFAKGIFHVGPRDAQLAAAAGAPREELAGRRHCQRMVES
jgi:hypothetical protein